MSKNKPYHNYQNYQNNRMPNDTEVTTVIPEEVTGEEIAETTETEEIVEAVEEVVVEEETVDAFPVQETLENVEPIKAPTIGVVFDCAKLRVRAAADPNADVLCELESGKEVAIDESASTSEFYKVCTETGAEGYCMKKFIKI